MPANIVNNGIKRRVVGESLAFLVTCGRDAIVKFIQRVNQERKAGLLVGGGIPLLLKQINDNIGESFPEEDILEFADSCRSYGPQHFFLYKVGAQDDALLHDLRSQNHVRRLLANQGLAECFNRSQWIWHSHHPELASVMQQNESRAIWTFKWVETRVWSSAAKPNGNAKAAPVLVTKKERSVNFFRIDFDSGECELCIQKMNANPQLSLQEEHDLYIGIIKKLLGLHQLHRLNLEPVIKRLLDSKDIKLRSWKVAYERGGYLKGAGDPKLAQRINLFLTPFIGMELNSIWLNSEYAGAFTSFDAKNDEIFVHNHFAHEQEKAVILDKIRRYSEIKFQNPMLRELASTNEHLKPAISAIDGKISRSAKDSIDCRKLADDHWIPQAEMLEAVEAILAANRNKDGLRNMFQVKYQVICPETNKPVLDSENKAVEYYDRNKIPNKINCHHPFPVGIKKHPTEGNIKPIIKVLPVPSFWDIGMWGMVERPSGLLSFMEKHLGKKYGLKTLQITLAIICSVIFFFAGYWIINGMLTFSTRFPQESNTINFMFTTLMLVSVLILFVFIITLFGSTIMTQALEALKNFMKTTLSIFKRKPAQNNHHKGHKKRTTEKSHGSIKHRHAHQIK